MPRFTIPSPAMGVALTALAVALGGTAYAGLTIRGGDVVNNSLTSADVRNETLTNRDVKDNTLGSGEVRNGTLRSRDFRADDLAALRGAAGQPGAPGAAGATGPAGPAGPRGPSAALATRNTGQVSIGSSYTTTIETTLPAGSWVVHASGTVNNNGAQTGWNCQLDAAGVIAETADNESQLGASAPTDREQFALTGSTTLGAPAAARLRCLVLGGNAVVLRPSITAIQVDSLTIR